MNLLTRLLMPVALVAAVNLAAAQHATNTLEFVAVDAGGKPVADLTSAELELKIGGQEAVAERVPSTGQRLPSTCRFLMYRNAWN